MHDVITLSDKTNLFWHFSSYYIQVYIVLITGQVDKQQGKLKLCQACNPPSPRPPHLPPGQVLSEILRQPLFTNFETLFLTDVRTSMLKARIFPKSLTKCGGIFKSMNCAFFSCVWSNRYVNHMEINFDDSNIIKWGDNQEHIYLP